MISNLKTGDLFMVKLTTGDKSFRNDIFKAVEVISNGIFARMYYSPQYFYKNVILFNYEDANILPVPADYLAAAEKIKNHDTYQKPLPMGMCRLPKLKLVGDRLVVDDSSAFRTNHIMPKIKKSIGVLDHCEILKDSFRN